MGSREVAYRPSIVPMRLTSGQGWKAHEVRLRWVSNKLIVVAGLTFLTVLGAASRSAGQGALTAQTPVPPSGTPQLWIENAVKHELEIIQDENAPPLRYQIHKISDRDDITRVVIESRQGSVARLVEHHGRALTAAEDAAERSRLSDILRSPEQYVKHERRDDAGRDYAIQLIKLIPGAMLFNFVPGQPQPAGAQSPQIVIDFKPDPSFHPPTMISEVLKGLQGRVWLDTRTGYMTRIQGTILHPINFGWGIIARIYPGSSIELEQTSVDGKRWVFSHLKENITMRAALVRTVTENANVTAWDFEFLPKPLSLQEAIHTLLAMPVKLRQP